MAHDSGLRLLLALALSTALHLSLIYGIAVGPSNPIASSMILARLQPQAATPSAGATVASQNGLRVAAPPSARPSVERAFEAPDDVSVKSRAEQVDLVPARIDDSRLPSADVPVLVDPTWYEAKDLDLYPRLLAPVQPAYPSSAQDPSGDVTLLLQIDEFGAVQQVSLTMADPIGYFEDAALRAFQLARFAPAQREGRPVRSRIVIKVRFAPQLRDGGEP